MFKYVINYPMFDVTGLNFDSYQTEEFYIHLAMKDF